MAVRYLFNRREMAGSLGDLGTLLPIAIGMIVVNGLNPTGVFYTIGLFYILSGWYYGVTVPVQPMKVIGAYAIATGMKAETILASGALMGAVLLIVGATGAISLIGRYTPRGVIRGVQLSTGVVLMTGGIKFILGTSMFQELHQLAEPYLVLQRIGPFPIGVGLGIVATLLTFWLLDSRRLPGGLVVVLCGLAIGVTLGTFEGFAGMQLGFHLPPLLPFGLPYGADWSVTVMMLLLPQVPMTLGNAVLAYADLSKEYFGEASRRVTYRAVCISMALANFLAFFIGGMPVCHGAGGLAAHYRFGARTAGSNVLIGSILLALAFLLGAHITAVLHLLPMAILGVLLLFAGSQLSLSILDVRERKDMFVATLMLGITLATNLAVAFGVGFLVAYALKSDKLGV